MYLIQDNKEMPTRLEQPNNKIINRQKNMSVPTNNEVSLLNTNSQYHSLSSHNHSSNNNFNSQPRSNNPSIIESHNFDSQPGPMHQLPKGSENFSNTNLGSFQEAKLNMNYSST